MRVEKLALQGGAIGVERNDEGVRSGDSTRVRPSVGQDLVVLGIGSDKIRVVTLVNLENILLRV